MGGYAPHASEVQEVGIVVLLLRNKRGKSGMISVRQPFTESGLCGPHSIPLTLPSPRGGEGRVRGPAKGWTNP